MRKIYFLLFFCLPGLILSGHQASIAQQLAYLPIQPLQGPERSSKELKAVLLSLEKKFDIHFTFESQIVRDKYVQSEVKITEEIEQTLGNVLHPLNLAFKKISDKYYTIYASEKEQRKEKDTKTDNRLQSTNPNSHETFVERSMTTASQTFQITVVGTVTDENDESLPGVNVLEKGTTNGTTTDASGRFTLNVEDEKSVLVFSFIGYAPQEVTVGNRTGLSVSLETDIRALQEVVVVGYGTQKKSDVTGAVVRMTTEKTEDLPNYNILQSLQGRVPGLNITSSNRPGGEPGLNIRGTNSISAGNNPLVVVDGIIYNGNLSDFNANDIATVDILKDASAAAVYGSRAANGVLLITTKSGTTDKPQFNFSTYHGIQEPDRLISVLDGPKYLQKVLDFREAIGLEADPARIDDYLTVGEGENRRNGATTDWMDRVIGTGMIRNYHLDVSGKTNNTNYYVAGTYFNQEGIVKNDKFDRITLNLNLTNHITDWYSVTVKSMFSTQDRSGREANVLDAYQQSPYGNFYDEDGPGGYALLPTGDPIGVHPFATTLVENEDLRTSLWGLFSSNLEVPFIPGLKWTMNASANQRDSSVYQFFDNESTSTGRTANGIATKNERKNMDWTIDNILNYRKTFSDVHSLDVTLLYSRENRRLKSSGLRGSNFFTQVLGYNNIELAQVQQITSNYEEQNSVAFMGRINYSYDDRYAITLSARRDGFSGFSQNHKYATFPSVALAWNATNEEFLNDISWLKYLKLRLSYGKNGNQAVGRYKSLARMNSNQYVFEGSTITSIYVSSMANNELTWETTLTKNAGIDFSVWHEKISGSIDVYSSNTDDILLRRALPQTSGFKEILTNVGKVHNHGVEVALNSVNLKNGRSKLSWETGFVFSLNRNRIDKLTGEDADKNGVEDDDVANGWFIGESLYSLYGYKTDGIHQLNESDIPAGFVPGDFRIADTNKDGSLTPDDRIILGNALPNYSFSISNTLRFRGFSLYVLINSIQGGGTKNYYVKDNNATRNVNAPFTTFSERFNVQDVPYWTPNRPSNEYPRINYNPSLPHYILEDRSFVRIQDVSLSYAFNKSLLDRMKVNNLRVYISGKNLYTFTKWTGYDPENATTLRDFPFLRAYTIGVDLKF